MAKTNLKIREVKKVTAFIQEAVAGVKADIKAHRMPGVYYMPILKKCPRYCLVIGLGEEGIQGKIAYNCDDLQCDYDIDWLMPQKHGEVYDTDHILSEDYSEEARMFIQQFYNFFD